MLIQAVRHHDERRVLAITRHDCLLNDMELNDRELNDREFLVDGAGAPSPCSGKSA